jgi:hypothetical protein
MPCESKGHMISDPKISLFIITKSNGFLKLKGFFKHDHFAYKTRLSKSTWHGHFVLGVV